MKKEGWPTGKAAVLKTDMGCEPSRAGSIPAPSARIPPPNAGYIVVERKEGKRIVRELVWTHCVYGGIGHGPYD